MTDRAILAIPANEYRRTRWRNGRGWTREVLLVPEDGAWDLRLSIAELEAVADFSPFPGMEREQVLLHGNGLRLHFDDGELVDLLPPHQRARFDGDRPVTAIPLEGPVQVFNAVWRPAALAVTVLHRPLVGGMWCFGDRTIRWAVYLLSGSARIGCDGQEPVGLMQGDTAWLAGTRRRYAIEGAGEALLVQVRPAGSDDGKIPAAGAPQ